MLFITPVQLRCVARFICCVVFLFLTCSNADVERGPRARGNPPGPHPHSGMASSPSAEVAEDDFQEMPRGRTRHHRLSRCLQTLCCDNRAASNTSSESQPSFDPRSLLASSWACLPAGRLRNCCQSSRCLQGCGLPVWMRSCETERCIWNQRGHLAGKAINQSHLLLSLISQLDEHRMFVFSKLNLRPEG